MYANRFFKENAKKNAIEANANLLATNLKINQLAKMQSILDREQKKWLNLIQSTERTTKQVIPRLKRRLKKRRAKTISLRKRARQQLSAHHLPSLQFIKESHFRNSLMANQLFFKNQLAKGREQDAQKTRQDTQADINQDRRRTL